MKAKSIFYLSIYALMIAMGHILQKMVLNHGVDRFVFAFLRITAGFLLIALLILYKKHNPVKVIKTNIRHFLILGIGFSGIGILMKLWGLSMTTATNASFLMSLSSVAAVIFAYFLLKEQAPKRFYFVVTVMILGVYLVTTKGERLLPQTGDIILFCLAFLIGSMQVYGKKVLKTVSVLQTAFGRSFVGSVFLGLLIIVFAPNGFRTIPSFPVLLLVLANGVTFSSSIILFYKALQTEGASNTGMFALLVPVMTAGMGYLLLAEVLNIYQILGGSIILSGSFLISRLKIKQANF
jgi:drug/metabolite transporter (DMT)-like permease